LPFVKGRKKTGGRAPGVPNKRTLQFQEKLQEVGLDPLKAIAELAPKLPPERLVPTLLKLLEFQYPIVKAQEAKSEIQRELDERIEKQNLEYHLESEEREKKAKEAEEERQRFLKS